MKPSGKKSLAATKNFNPDTPDLRTEAGVCTECSAPTEKQGASAKAIRAAAEQKAYPHTFSQSCASCHDSDIDYAPRIPFSDPNKFRSWLKDGDNAAKVRERLLHPDEEKRMPQNKRLTEDEINTLIHYISVSQ